MPISQRDRLHQDRTYAAYAAVGTITSAICFCRQNRTQDALRALERAIADYEQADRALQAFNSAPKKESQNVVTSDQQSAA